MTTSLGSRVFISVVSAALVGVWLVAAAWAAPVPIKHDAIQRSALTEDQKLVHLLNRITFGARPGDIEAVRAVGVARFIEQQLDPASIDDADLDARLRRLETIHLSTEELAALFPHPALRKRLVEKGLIGRRDFRGPRQPRDRQRRDEQPREGQPPGERMIGERRMADSFFEAPAMEAAEDKAGPRGQGERRRRGMANLIFRPITRLPEPIYMEAERGRNGARTIKGVNPPQLIVAQMQAAKLTRAIHSERQLEEMMVDFWLNHFNVYARKGGPMPALLPAYERDVIRAHALGSFRDLLGATAHAPAMLFYLDNFQSMSPDSFVGKRRDRGLNENYARELMELHTLGVDGGYTQQDVIEVAKVFTGWTFLGDRSRAMAQMGRRRFRQMSPPVFGDAGFVFLPPAHAPGEKTVLGRRIREGGMDEGEQVLDMLAAHPSTARFLATKLVRRFVADEPPAALVDQVAHTYKRTEGDIRAMLRTIFQSPQFWSAESFQAKTKKPLELFAGAVRALDGDFTPTPMAILAMERMGEPLYLCQPPTGYPDVGEEWLNTGTLLYRWKFALGVATGEMPGVKTEIPDEVAGEDVSDVLRQLADRLVRAQLSEKTQANIEKAVTEQLALRPDPQAPLGDREVRYLAGLLLGSPEFQRR